MGAFGSGKPECRSIADLPIFKGQIKGENSPDKMQTFMMTMSFENTSHKWHSTCI
jgi:hypothetical protein